MLDKIDKGVYNITWEPPGGPLHLYYGYLYKSYIGYIGYS